MQISTLLSQPAYVIGFIIIIIGTGIFLTCKSRRMPYYACDALLTDSELKFYNILKMAKPYNTSICMKVRMADLINCDDHHWKSGWGPKISAKHIDFVLIDSDTTTIQLAIELDDSTHRTNKDRIDRDKFVNKAFEVAGVSLLRIPTKRNYDLNNLKKLINQSIDLDPQQI